MLKKYIGVKSAWLYLCLILCTCVFIACKDDEEGSNGTTQLLSFGPSPVLRGGEIRFIGNGLNKVTAIVLPGNVEVTTFKVKTPELIVIDVPEETISGEVVIRSPDGNFATKTILEISEPIEMTSFSPAKARPGDILTINGEYLNLIKEISFVGNQTVTLFESQSRSKIELKIPSGAISGKFVLSNGKEIPILISSETDLEVVLPVATQVSPTPVKAMQQLTITGTNLDLTNEILFEGGKSTKTFVSKTATQIVVVVPDSARDGKIKLIPASLMASESLVAIEMMMPTITSVTPNPVKTGATITVTGTNLDLVNRGVFGGDKAGAVQGGGTSTQITVQVPADAMLGKVNFWTTANKSVASSTDLTLIKPAITSFSPGSLQALNDLTINGTNLDIVKSVKFTGGTSAVVSGATLTQIIVKVPTGSQSGKITLVANNGDEVVSATDLTVTGANVPVVTTITPTAKTGDKVTIQGTKLDLAISVVFPGGVKATIFGVKSATLLEVFVPEGVQDGTGKITFVTSDNQSSQSPDIIIQGDIKVYIYDEAVNSAWQKWGGWGTTIQDISNVEHPKRDSKAIKISYNDSYGALQLHPNDPSAFNGYTKIVLSIYGGPSSEGTKIALQVKSGTTYSSEPQMIVKEGEYKTFEILLSALGSPTVVDELLIKNYGTNPNTIYIDDIGLK